MEGPVTGKAFLSSPIGWLEILSSPKGIRAVTFLDDQKTEPRQAINTWNCASGNWTLISAKNCISFGAAGSSWHSLSKKVWQRLLEIPHGESRSYQEIALELGDEKSIRAVGTANGRNPIALIVPCHRVIGKDGSLTGYAGGLHRKEWLLQHEGHPLYVHQQLPLF